MKLPWNREPMFKKPCGESAHFRSGMLTSRSVVCELCGTKHPKNSDLPLIRVLGLQVVETCCGSVIDELYKEWGPSFTEAFLEDFANNPADPRFTSLRRFLPQRLQEAQATLRECSGQVTAAQGNLSQVEEQLKEVKPE